MHEIQMVRGARKLLEVCASVQAEEEVLIIADYPMEKIAKAIATAAFEIGAEPILTFLAPRKRDGQEPPQAVAQAMKQAGVFLAPVSKSITHTHAVKEAIQAGARGLMLTQYRDDMLIYGGIEADFEGIAPTCEALAQVFDEGKHLLLTTRKGTDLDVDIEGRRGNALTCLVQPGQFSPVPNVEANVSPLEGSANGRLVVDASIPYIDIGVLEQDILVRVEEGLIQSIHGGRQAKVLADNLTSFNDPMVYNIAEIGLGLNPYSRLTGCMLDDEGVLKTLHIGIGTSITLGGTVKAACHYDLLMWNPNITIDGVLIVEEGELRI